MEDGSPETLPHSASLQDETHWTRLPGVRYAHPWLSYVVPFGTTEVAKRERSEPLRR